MFHAVKSAKLIAAALLIANVTMPLAGSAQAEQARKPLAAKSAASAPARHAPLAHRVLPDQVANARAEARPEGRHDCFWCNRETTISGLSF